MSSTQRNVALVTGAGSGIGAAIATRLIGRGYTVYGTSRKVEASRSTPLHLVMRAIDVRDEKAIVALVDEVVRDAGRIDVLVNNAGSTLVGALEETALAEAKDLFDINFFGALRATNAVLPHMRAARRGRIVFISSVLGFLPAPFMGIYAASKHAIEGYAETLDHEVREFGIRSILVEPAYTATKFAENQRDVARRLPDYAAVEGRVARKIVEEVRRGGSPDRVADAVLEAVAATTPKLRYPVGNPARSLSRLRRFVPARIFDRSFRRQFLLDA